MIKPRLVIKIKQIKIRKRRPTKPSRLLGRFVYLDLIKPSHVLGLEKYFSERLTQYFPEQFSSAQEYYSRVVKDKCFGPCELYTIFHLNSGQPIGCTGFFYIEPSHKKLDIGGSWIGLNFQGTAANVESKFLLLKRAFEVLKYKRIGVQGIASTIASSLTSGSKFQRTLF